MKTKKFLSLVSAAVIGAVSLCPTLAANAAYSTTDSPSYNITKAEPVDILLYGDSTMNLTQLPNSRLNKDSHELLRMYYNRETTNYWSSPATLKKIKTDFNDLKSYCTDNQSYVDFTQSKIIVLTLGSDDIYEIINNAIEKKYPAIYNSNSGNLFNVFLSLANTLSKSPDPETKFAELLAFIDTELTAELPDIIDNYDYVISQIKGFNPTAQIAVQTVYNPLLIGQSEIDTLFKGKPELYKTGYNAFKDLLNKHFGVLNTGIKETLGTRNKVNIVDTAVAFEDGETGFGYSGLYTNILTDSHDFNLNALGTVVVTNKIIKKLGYILRSNVSPELDYYYSNFYCDVPESEYKGICDTLDIIKGDGDGDCLVDAADASLALGIYTSVQTGADFYDVADAANLIALDIDRSGSVDASDASDILAHYTNIQSGGEGLF